MNIIKRFFILSIIIITTLPNSLLAQKIRTNKVSDTYILVGNVGESTITMTLTIDDNNKATGRYYDHSENMYLEVAGNATISGAIVLDEIHDEHTKDKREFIGTFDVLNATFIGDLISSNTEVAIPFRLSQTTNSPINHIESFGIYYYEKFEYEYEYITLSNPSNTQGIINLNKIFEYAAERSELFLLSHLEDYRENYGSESADYAFNYFTSFLYADKNIISVSISSYEYTGGAHGYGGQIYYIYNLHTAKLLSESLASIIANKDNADLVALLQSKLAANYKQSDFFDFDNIRLNDNYYIDDSGVHFLYNPYEIAPYALGQISVSFTFDELKPYVDQMSPFYYLFR